MLSGLRSKIRLRDVRLPRAEPWEQRGLDDRLPGATDGDLCAVGTNDGQGSLVLDLSYFVDVDDCRAVYAKEVARIQARFE